MSQSSELSCEGSVEREPGSPREMQDGSCQTDRLSESSTSTTSESQSTTDLTESPDSPEHNIPKISWQVKLEQARDFKSQGNDKYQAGLYKPAIGRYHRALLFVKGIQDAQQSMPFMPETEEFKQGQGITTEAQNEVKELKVACYNNLAACILNTEDPTYSKVVQYCDNVLQISPNNTKALYRKAVALYHMQQVEKALQILQLAKQQPGGEADKKIEKYCQLCKQALKQQENKLKKTYQAMFEKMAMDEVEGMDAADDEEVFSTSPASDPKVVQPTRKLKKARSTDTSPY